MFIPALIYAILEMYFYAISIGEGSSRIYRELGSSGFYFLIEFIRFIFNIILGILAIQFLVRIKKVDALSTKDSRQLNWLILFSKIFIGYNTLSLILTIIIQYLDHKSILAFNLLYLTFFINTILIYWIGYVGFTKPNSILPKIGWANQNLNQEKTKLIEAKLKLIMETETLFTQEDFSLPKLALATNISHKELSEHINTIHKCNVSEYINRYRVNKVKALIDDSDFAHYTLEAISFEAGFKSKSSFNSIFK